MNDLNKFYDDVFNNNKKKESFEVIMEMLMDLPEYSPEEVLQYSPPFDNSHNHSHSLHDHVHGNHSHSVDGMGYSMPTVNNGFKNVRIVRTKLNPYETVINVSYTYNNNVFKLSKTFPNDIPHDHVLDYITKDIINSHHSEYRCLIEEAFNRG